MARAKRDTTRDATKTPEPVSTTHAAYTIRRPGRPRKPENQKIQADGAKSTGGVSAEPAKEEGSSLRFEMRLPPGVVADLELMRARTGNTFADYIRQAILRVLDEDKKSWNDR